MERSCALVGKRPSTADACTNNAQILTAYAQYFVKWVQAYSQQGITIESVAPQNEPNYAQLPVLPLDVAALSRSSSASISGPAFTAAASQHQDHARHDVQRGTSDDPSVVSAVMADATAKSYIKVLGYQWAYGEQRRRRQIVQPAPLADRAQMRKLSPGVAIRRRRRPSIRPWRPTTRPMGWRAGGSSADWIKAGVTAYSAWNMVLDTVGHSNDTTRPGRRTPSDREHVLEDAEHHAGLLRVPPSLPVRRGGRQGRHDQRRRRAGVQESRRQYRDRHVQLGSGGHVHPRRRRTEAAVLACPPMVGPPSTTCLSVEPRVTANGKSGACRDIFPESRPRKCPTVRTALGA